MRNVIQPFRTAFLRVSESSAGFCLLLSFIPRPRLLQKTLSEITLAFIQELLCPAGSGKPETATATSAFAGSLVLLFAIASQVSTDTECSRVLLGSLSCDCSEVIAVFDRRIWRIISGEVSVSMQPWASFTLISVMRCDLHWQSEQKWDISIGNINDNCWWCNSV